MVAIETARAGQVGLAQLEPSDGEALRRLFYRLSPETIYRRFLSPLRRPDQARPERLLDVDHVDREAIVAVVDGEIVGVARYSRGDERGSAEVAIVVADAWQRQGLGTRLLSALGDRARAAGIAQFQLTMLAENRGALALLRRFDPEPRFRFGGGVLEASLGLGPAS